jgi:uncharacterized protein YndB with AHSA1/START domain
MTVTNVEKDPDALTMTLTAEFTTTVRRAWELWNDPRQLERWWGPPTWPATFVEHSLARGSTCTYFMTGPDGTKAHGWWRILRVDPPDALEFEDGFGDEHGAPDDTLPISHVRVELSPTSDELTRMTVRTTFPSREAMEQVLAMGAEEGMTLAIGQIDEILAAETADRGR